MIPQSVYLFLLIELIAVSYLDILSRKISNLWPILNITLFFIILFIIPQSYAFEFRQFFFSIVFLIVGFVLFLLKVMGPGDTKFLFSLFLIIPVSFHDSAFVCLLYSTIMVGGSLFIVNTIQNFEKLSLSFKIRDIGIIKKVYGKKFSYAPVILISWIWFGWENMNAIF